MEVSGRVFHQLTHPLKSPQQNKEADDCFGQVIDNMGIIDQLVISGRNSAGETARRSTRNKTSDGSEKKDSLWYVSGVSTQVAMTDAASSRSSPQVEEILEDIRGDNDDDFVEVSSRKRSLKLATSSGKKRPKKPDEKKGAAEEHTEDNDFSRSVDEELLLVSSSLQLSAERPRYCNIHSDDDAVIVSL